MYYSELPDETFILSGIFEASKLIHGQKSNVFLAALKPLGNCDGEWKALLFFLILRSQT